MNKTIFQATSFTMTKFADNFGFRFMKKKKIPLSPSSPLTKDNITCQLDMSTGRNFSARPGP